MFCPAIWLGNVYFADFTVVRCKCVIFSLAYAASGKEGGELTFAASCPNGGNASKKAVGDRQVITTHECRMRHTGLESGRTLVDGSLRRLKECVYDNAWLKIYIRHCPVLAAHCLWKTFPSNARLWMRMKNRLRMLAGSTFSTTEMREIITPITL